MCISSFAIDDDIDGGHGHIDIDVGRDHTEVLLLYHVNA